MTYQYTTDILFPRIRHRLLALHSYPGLSFRTWFISVISAARRLSEIPNIASVSSISEAGRAVQVMSSSSVTLPYSVLLSVCCFLLCC